MAPEGLILQRSFYIGNALSGILYGIQLTLASQSIHYLRKSRQVHKNFYIAFSVILTLLNGIGTASNVLYGQLVWIERGQETPGGPIVYFAENTAWWFNVLGTASGVTGDFMSQALLLYRLYIIMGGSFWVIVLPGLIMLSSTAMAIVSTVQSALPNEFIINGKPAAFGVPWVSISVSFNAVVTLIIVIRLLCAQRTMRGVTSPAHSETYTGVMAIMVESALPLALVGIVFSVFYGKNSPAGVAFAAVWGSLVGIAPQWIILRVAMGSGWTRNTMISAAVNMPVSSVQFAGTSRTGMTNIESAHHDHGFDEEKLAVTSVEQSVSMNGRTWGTNSSGIFQTSYTETE